MDQLRFTVTGRVCLALGLGLGLG